MPSEKPAYHVLIVEDEYFIADDVARALRQEGVTVSGPAADVTDALAALDEAKVNFAVIDINLDGVASFTVPAELRKRNIPFVFLTGYDRSVVPTEFSDAVVLQKPNGREAIVSEVRRQRQAASAA